MAQHNQLGRLGEDAACRYLLSRDIRILERNWRHHQLEVDIIAEDFGEIIFIEVKTRSHERWADAAAAVDTYKQRHLLRAARAYLSLHGLSDAPYRFDIITLIGHQPPFELTHYPNAFTAHTHAAISPEERFF